MLLADDDLYSPQYSTSHRLGATSQLDICSIITAYYQEVILYCSLAYYKLCDIKASELSKENYMLEGYHGV